MIELELKRTQFSITPAKNYISFTFFLVFLLSTINEIRNQSFVSLGEQGLPSSCKDKRTREEGFSLSRYLVSVFPILLIQCIGKARQNKNVTQKTRFWNPIITFKKFCQSWVAMPFLLWFGFTKRSSMTATGSSITPGIPGSFPCSSSVLKKRI